MLIITRKPGQGVWIGEDIYVLISDIQGRLGQVKIGIDAPSDVNILRDELLQNKDELKSQVEEVCRRFKEDLINKIEEGLDVEHAEKSLRV